MNDANVIANHLRLEANASSAEIKARRDLLSLIRAGAPVSEQKVGLYLAAYRYYIKLMMDGMALIPENERHRLFQQEHGGLRDQRVDITEWQEIDEWLCSLRHDFDRPKRCK